MVHQDVKPSNVTLHKNKTESKLSDLGRADRQGVTARHTNYSIAGDPDYAPIEQKYDYILPDWAYRRQSCDLYLLGSMITFFFTQTQMTNLIKSFLPSEYHWNNWTGKNYKDVLPFLLDAFDNACIFLEGELKKYFTDDNVIQELVQMVRQLCFPMPEKRGHPDYQPFSKIHQFLLEKYISRLDVLAKNAEAEM
jgi:serine/threonine protein kinase